MKIEPADVVLLKKGFGRVDGKVPGDYGDTTEVDQQTIKGAGLRWNKLIIISQVPMNLRQTKPVETNNGQNRDEQNKQFVGDLLFGHNPPDQNDSGGIQTRYSAHVFEVVFFTPDLC